MATMRETLESRVIEAKREMEIRTEDMMCSEKSRMNARETHKKASWELGEHKIQQSGDVWAWAK